MYHCNKYTSYRNIYVSHGVNHGAVIVCYTGPIYPPYLRPIGAYLKGPKIGPI